jgi:NitT/TauT family transport system ATP-binding protein
LPELALKLVEVAYTYAPGRRPLEALASVSLEVAKGEFISVVGPSGCGKTTLLRLIAGLVQPTSGHLYLAGPGPVGFVFQSAALMPWRTVLQNVMLPLEVGPGPKPPPRAREARARELIWLVGLEGFEDAYPRELSQGMQQRAALARALMNDPALLLLDEPFASLDLLSREKMNEELQRVWLARPSTVLMVTHSIDEAVFLSDRVVVLSQRPGQVRGIFAIPFERPRSAWLRFRSDFAALASAIRQAIDGADASAEPAERDARARSPRSG